MLHNPSFEPMLKIAPKVLVAVCTYKRPKMLEICLNSLAIQAMADFRYSILVVDNDKEKSAVDAFNRADRNSKINMYYVGEPVRGIARARNRALEFARQMNYSHVAFIDDDEIADINWLSGLMVHADMPFVSGHKIMTYGNIPEWQQPKQGKALRTDQQSVDRASTANVLIGPKLVHSPLRFDEALGLGGGEDTDYFRRASKLGMRGLHTFAARTYEAAHPERMTIRGQCHRTFWMTAAELRVDYLHGAKPIWRKIPAIMGGFFQGAIWLILGSLTFPFARNLAKKRILKGCKAIAKSQGGIAALVGHIPQAYTKTVGS